MASDLGSVRRRAGIVFGVLLLAMLGLCWRAFEIAVREHDHYVALGHRQHLRTYRLDASRGDVVDRNFLSLAVNDRIDRIVINPRLLRSEGLDGAVLAQLTAMFPEEDPEYLRAELARDKAYRMLRMGVTSAQAEELRRAGLPGLRLEPVPERVYPRQLLAAHVLGRVDGQGKGNLGIELGMDGWLRGREATSPAQFAVKGGKKLLVDGAPDPGVSRGHTVVSTLDSAIQAMVEEELDGLVRDWHPVGASIVVMDPDTGEILALANRPTFDPNHGIQSVHQTRNLAVQAAYEPGSTMKAITVAAALEQGTIRRDQTFFCEEGRWQYTPQHAIRDTKPSKWLSVTEILSLSSNICTTKIADTLGKQALHRWVRRFGFGERPSIELPGANPGLLAEWRTWSDIQMANIAFGQGMSASPLQVTAAFAALANGGLYNAPTLVKQIVAEDGSIVEEHRPTRQRVVRAATARTLLEMLTSVVHTRTGTGNKARVEGYRVAGKTSTAQKANPAGGYFEDQYYASFVGAVPAERPRLVVLVSVDNPEGGHYGNDVAAPTFARVAGRVLAYLGVPREDGSVSVPDEIRLAASDPKIVEGFIPDLDVEPALPGARRVALDVGLPDFTGLTLVQAVKAAETAQVRLHAVGTGIAVGQDTAPGPIADGATVTVHFEPPA
jgi:cell division protein FtsI (penicillin-binding protein 3)